MTSVGQRKQRKPVKRVRVIRPTKAGLVWVSIPERLLTPTERRAVRRVAVAAR